MNFSMIFQSEIFHCVCGFSDERAKFWLVSCILGFSFFCIHVCVSACREPPNTDAVQRHADYQAVRVSVRQLVHVSVLHRLLSRCKSSWVGPISAAHNSSLWSNSCTQFNRIYFLFVYLFAPEAGVAHTSHAHNTQDYPTIPMILGIDENRTQRWNVQP